MRTNKLALLIASLITTPAFGGWWSNYEDESWCHRVAEYKYCLPTTFKLERLEGAHLDFIDRSDEYISVFAKYMGDDAVDEVLADWPPKELVFESDKFVNGLRLIRYTPNKAEMLNHNLMVVFVVFPDESIVQIFGRKSLQTENVVNTFVDPLPI